MKWLFAMALCAVSTPALAQSTIKIAITGRSDLRKARSRDLGRLT